MIAHYLPLSAALLASSLCRVIGRAGGRGGCRFGRLDRIPLEEGQDGPVCVPLHAPPGREGAGIRTGLIPCGARPRWLRRALLLPGARPPGARCRRQRPTGRDRGADRGLPALFGSARAVRPFALWDERDPQGRWRGSRSPHRYAQGPCGDHRRGDLRGPWPQISNLGARPLSRGTRGGHREGPCIQAGAGQPDGGGAGETARSAGMMTSSGSNAVAGGLARHIPVLAATAIEWLAVRSGGIYLDATFGGGGYTRAILQTSGARVIAIDRDSNAVAAGAALEREAQGRLTLTEGLFSDLDAIAARHGASGLDGVVLDVGISSMQIDDAARGFS